MSTGDYRTIPEGIEQNMEMVKDYYNYMIFDAGDVTNTDLVPVNEVLRKPVSAVRDGTTIIFTASATMGDLTEDVAIKSVWIAGIYGESIKYLAVHKVSETTIGPSLGLTYHFPHHGSGHTESEA